MNLPPGFTTRRTQVGFEIYSGDEWVGEVPRENMIEGFIQNLSSRAPTSPIQAMADRVRANLLEVGSDLRSQVYGIQGETDDQIRKLQQRSNYLDNRAAYQDATFGKRSHFSQAIQQLANASPGITDATANVLATHVATAYRERGDSYLEGKLDMRNAIVSLLGSVTGQPMASGRIAKIAGGARPTNEEKAWMESYGNINPNDITALQGIRTIRDASNAVVMNNVGGMISFAASREEKYAPGGDPLTSPNVLEDVQRMFLHGHEALKNYEMHPDPAYGTTSRSANVHVLKQATAGLMNENRAMRQDAQSFLKQPGVLGSMTDEAVDVGGFAEYEQRQAERQKPWFRNINIPKEGLPLPMLYSSTGRIDLQDLAFPSVNVGKSRFTLGAPPQGKEQVRLFEEDIDRLDGFLRAKMSEVKGIEDPHLRRNALALREAISLVAQRADPYIHEATEQDLSSSRLETEFEKSRDAIGGGVGAFRGSRGVRRSMKVIAPGQNQGTFVYDRSERILFDNTEDTGQTPFANSATLQEMPDQENRLRMEDQSGIMEIYGGDDFVENVDRDRSRALSKITDRRDFSVKYGQRLAQEGIRAARFDDLRALQGGNFVRNMRAYEKVYPGLKNPSVMIDTKEGERPLVGDEALLEAASRADMPSSYAREARRRGLHKLPAKYNNQVLSWAARSMFNDILGGEPQLPSDFSEFSDDPMGEVANIRRSESDVLNYMRKDFDPSLDELRDYAVSAGAKFRSLSKRLGSQEQIALKTSGDKSIEVDTFSSPHASEPTTPAVAAARVKAARMGEKIVGIEHTHPSGEQRLSYEDVVASEMERQAGVSDEFRGPGSAPINRSRASRIFVPNEELGSRRFYMRDGGMPPPPDDFFWGTPPEEEPEQPSSRRMGVTFAEGKGLREAYQPIPKRLATHDRTQIVRGPTGSGKTNLLMSPFSERDFGIFVEPNNTLAQDITNRIQAGFDESAKHAGLTGHQAGKAIFLKGYPGEIPSDATPEQRADLERQQGEHQASMDALGKAVSERYTMKEGMITGLKPGAGPLAMVMTGHKAGASMGGALGSMISQIHNVSKGFYAVDEADTLFETGSHLARGFLPAAREMGMSGLAVSATLTDPQVAALQNVTGGEFTNVTRRDIDPNVRDLDLRFQLTSNRTVNEDVLGSLDPSGPGLVFGRVDQTRSVSDFLRQKFPGAFRYHRSDTDALSPGEMATAQGKLQKGGMGTGDVGVTTVAAATGLDIPELKSGAGISMYGMREMIQGAGRVDPLRTAGGPFTLLEDPSVRNSRIRRLENSKNLLTATNFDRAWDVVKGAYEGTSENYRIAGTQLDKALGSHLKELGADPHLSSDILSYFNEAGLLNLETTQNEAGESIYSYTLTNRNSAELIHGKHVKSSKDLTTSMSIPERFKEDVESRISEQKGIKSLGGRIGGMDPKDAGEFFKRGAEAWQAGGSEGLEKYASQELPKEIVNEYFGKLKTATEDYVAAMKRATEAVGEGTSSQEQVTQANKTYRKSVVDAERMVAGPANADVRAAIRSVGSELSARSAIGQTDDVSAVVGDTINRRFGGSDQGMAPDFGGGTGGRQQQGGRFGSNPAMGLLYGAYMAKRMFGWVVQPELAAASDVPDYAPAALVGDFGSTRADMRSGFNTRMAIGQEFQARVANESYGAFMEAPYVMSQLGTAGEALTRFGSTSRVGTGLGIAGAEVGIGMKFAGGALAAAAPAVIGGSLMAGAGILGMGAGIEIGNALVAEGGLFAGEDPAPAMTMASGAKAVIRGGVGYYSSLMSNISDMGLAGIGRSMIEAPVMGLISMSYGHGKEGLEASRASRYIPEPILKWLDPGKDKDSEAVEAVQEEARQLAETVGGAPTDYIQSLTRFNAGGITGDKTKFFQTGVGLGLGTDYQSTFEQLADMQGLRAGSGAYQQFFGQMEGIGSLGQLSDLQNKIERTAQRAGYFSMFTDSQGQAYKLAEQFETGSQAQGAMSLMQLVEQLGGNVKNIVGYEASEVGQRGFTKAPQAITERDQLASIAEQYQTTWKYGAGLISPLVEAGYLKPDQFGSALGGLMQQFQGYNPQQMGMVAQIAQGDLRAMSYASYNQPQILQDMGMGLASSRFFDQSGNQIYETSGSDFLRMGISQAQMGNTAALQHFGNVSPGNMMQQAQSFFGIDNQPMMQSYLDGGLRGAQAYTREALWANQQAQMGISWAQIASQENYLAELYPLQDKQRELQYESTMAGFEYNKTRMETSNAFAIRQEDISLRQMNLNNQYEGWQLGFQHSGMQAQQAFQREQWGYQDTLRGLGFQFQMEDMDEAIRFSSGRDRRKLVRQRERLALTHNIQEDQIDSQRDFAEDQFAREEEQFQKRKEYVEELNKLEKEQFDLNVERRETFYEMEKENLERQIKEFQEQFELQGEIIELNRKHQQEELDFQKSRLALQAESMQLQHDLEEITRKSNDAFSDIAGYLQNISQYENARTIIGALQNVLGNITNIPLSNITMLGDLFEALSNISPSNIQGAANAYDLD